MTHGETAGTKVINNEFGDTLLNGTLEAGEQRVLFFAINECEDGRYRSADSNALNYNENANSDDGSCEYDIVIVLKYTNQFVVLMVLRILIRVSLIVIVFLKVL